MNRWEGFDWTDLFQVGLPELHDFGHFGRGVGACQERRLGDAVAEEPQTAARDRQQDAAALIELHTFRHLARLVGALQERRLGDAVGEEPPISRLLLQP